MIVKDGYWVVSSSIAGVCYDLPMKATRNIALPALGYILDLDSAVETRNLHKLPAIIDFSGFVACTQWVRISTAPQLTTNRIEIRYFRKN